MLLKAAMPFNVSSPEYLSPHERRKNRVSPVSRASPAHMNSPLNRQKVKKSHLKGLASCMFCLKKNNNVSMFSSKSVYILVRVFILIFFVYISHIDIRPDLAYTDDLKHDQINTQFML